MPKTTGKTQPDDTSVDTLDLTPDPRIGEEIRWAPQTLIKLAVVAAAVGVTGAYTLHWGDGASTETAAGAGAVRHTYALPGAYTLAAKQGETVVASTLVFVRDTLAPVVTFAPAADNPNIVEATFKDEPADLASQYEITWAPGQVETKWAPNGTVVAHGFQAGEHTIVVRDLRTGRSLSHVQTVTDKVYDPDFTVAAGVNPMTAEITLSRVGTVKNILVDWGDGSQQTITSPSVGAKQTHAYSAADTYIIQVVYSDGTGEGAARIFTASNTNRTPETEPAADAPASENGAR